MHDDERWHMLIIWYTCISWAFLGVWEKDKMSEHMKFQADNLLECYCQNTIVRRGLIAKC